MAVVSAESGRISPYISTRSRKATADPGGHPGLVEKHGDELGIAGQVGHQPLDGHDRANPAGPARRPKWTVAMPPEAISEKSV